jgi:hypothetical protein
MVIAMTTLIGLAVLCVLAYGFLGEREVWDLEAGEGLLGRLKKRRERLLRAIKDLEQERESGKLSEDEFRTLRNDLKLRAIRATRDLDRVRALRVRNLARQRGGLSPSRRKHIEGLVQEAAKRRSLAGAAAARDSGRDAGGGGA